MGVARLGGGWAVTMMGGVAGGCTLMMGDIALAPIQIDQRHIALFPRHDVGIRQFPLSAAGFAPYDQPVIADIGPGRESRRRPPA
jgi:hypothetical protein